MPQIDLSIPSSVKEEAARGLKWVEEFGRGGTSVGRTTARRLVNETAATPEFVRKIARYFPRHEVDKEAEGFRPGEDGYPSNGRIAWALWGGDAGRDWSNRKVKELDRQNEKESMSKLETMNFRFNVTETKELNRNGIKVGFIKGYAATFDIDRVNDRIMRGAFRATIAEHKARGRQIRMLWQHNSNELIGGFMPDAAVEDDKGLWVEGDINLETQRGREAYALAKQGVLSDLSIGYIAKDYDIQSGVRDIKEIDLYEVSLVSEPANTLARIVEVKSVTEYADLPLADVTTEWDSEAAIARVREFTGSTEEPSDSYENAFLWYDDENEEDFTAYKLPIADVIEGKLVAVPRAIFSAAAAVQGARGGLDIPEYDRPSLIAHIERYYEKMGRESPFEKGLGIDELKQMPIHLLQAKIKSAGFDRKASKLLTDCYLADQIGIKRRRDAAEICGADKGAQGAAEKQSQGFEEAMKALTEANTFFNKI